jgi:hypothetical protein
MNRITALLIIVAGLLYGCLLLSGRLSKSMPGEEGAFEGEGLGLLPELSVTTVIMAVATVSLCTAFIVLWARIGPVRGGGSE